MSGQLPNMACLLQQEESLEDHDQSGMVLQTVVFRGGPLRYPQLVWLTIG